MSQSAAPNEQEVSTCLLITLGVLWLAFSLGPLVLVMAAATAMALRVLQAKPVIAFYAAFASAAGGMLLHQNFTLWLMGPVNMMYGFYAHAFPDNIVLFFASAGAFDGFARQLAEQSWRWLSAPSLWLAYAPAGIFCGAVAYGLFKSWFKNPLGHLKRQKSVKKIHGKVGDLPATLVNQRAAETAKGSLIGTDRHARSVELSDKAANQHTLVLGTTGSGKTVTVCNIVESAINRALPLIYIDGKGDYDLAFRIARYGQERGRPVSVFAMKGESIAYNPLATGGFTSKKDRIIELREWSEEHYKKLAEGYLQTVFKVMERCGLPCDLYSLSQNLDLKRLKALVRDHEKSIPSQARFDKKLRVGHRTSPEFFE